MEARLQHLALTIFVSWQPSTGRFSGLANGWLPTTEAENVQTAGQEVGNPKP